MFKNKLMCGMLMLLSINETIFAFFIIYKYMSILICNAFSSKAVEKISKYLDFMMLFISDGSISGCKSAYD
jgi:hypothetical protein